MTARTSLRVAGIGGAVREREPTTTPVVVQKAKTTTPKKSTPTTTIPQLGVYPPLAGPNKITYQQPANPSQRPYTTPSAHGRASGEEWQVGDLLLDQHTYLDSSLVLGTDAQGKAVPYAPGFEDIHKRFGFKFHYNPSSVGVSYQGSSDFVPNQVTSALGSIPLTQAPSVISFQVLLNRSEDIYDQVRLPYRVRGTYHLADLGTNYDLEWLFFMVNGGVAISPGGDTTTADIGLLLPTPLQLRLSTALTWNCYLTGIDVNHVKFTPQMVPMVSLITLSFGRYTSAVIPPPPVKAT